LNSFSEFTAEDVDDGTVIYSILGAVDRSYLLLSKKTTEMRERSQVGEGFDFMIAT